MKSILVLVIFLSPIAFGFQFNNVKNRTVKIEEFLAPMKGWKPVETCSFIEISDDDFDIICIYEDRNMDAYVGYFTRARKRVGSFHQAAVAFHKIGYKLLGCFKDECVFVPNKNGAPLEEF